MPKKTLPPEPASDLQGKIREAEFKNILQKLKDGKTLTARESKIAAEFAAQRDGRKGLTQTELAAMWGMTQPNIHKMVKQGMPMTSIEAATAWRKQFLEERTPASYNEARTRKAFLECDKLDMQIAILRGDYEEKAKVREEGIRIGAILDARGEALINDGGTILAGLDERGVTKKLAPLVRGMLREFRDELEKL
jgi:hypothetical protein